MKVRMLVTIRKFKGGEIFDIEPMRANGYLAAGFAEMPNGTNPYKIEPPKIEIVKEEKKAVEPKKEMAKEVKPKKKLYRKSSHRSKP